MCQKVMEGRLLSCSQKRGRDEKTGDVRRLILLPVKPRRRACLPLIIIGAHVTNTHTVERKKRWRTDYPSDWTCHISTPQDYMLNKEKGGRDRASSRLCELSFSFLLCSDFERTLRHHFQGSFQHSSGKNCAKGSRFSRVLFQIKAQFKEEQFRADPARQLRSLKAKITSISPSSSLSSTV